MISRKLRIAIVGLNFGRCFVPLYQKHPDVGAVGVCDTDPQRLAWAREHLGVTRLHTDLAEVIGNRAYDAIHLLTPVTTHAALTLRVLRAGQHCACAVPMGLSREELEEVIAARESAGLNYMMMETAVYSRSYFRAQDLYRRGTLGRIQLLRGCHSQDLEHNRAWWGLPPMWYITHALAPLLDLLDTRATEVVCYGSGEMRAEFAAAYGNPFPIETALFALEKTAAKAEITRTLLETAPYGGEAFDIYGDRATFATIGREHDPLLTTILPFAGQGKRRLVTEALGDIPSRLDLLPESLRGESDGGHGGSHAHLVHEFVRSIVEGRPPYVHARRAANWCIPGLRAHASALAQGAKMSIPAY